MAVLFLNGNQSDKVVLSPNGGSTLQQKQRRVMMVFPHVTLILMAEQTRNDKYLKYLGHEYFYVSDSKSMASFSANGFLLSSLILENLNLATFLPQILCKCNPQIPGLWTNATCCNQSIKHRATWSNSEMIQ
jgi:hypothetical protein